MNFLLLARCQGLKQECGLGAFEVRTYRSLMRHWLLVRLAMVFLAAFVLYYFINWKYLSTVWGLS